MTQIDLRAAAATREFAFLPFQIYTLLCDIRLLSKKRNLPVLDLPALSTVAAAAALSIMRLRKKKKCPKEASRNMQDSRLMDDGLRLRSEERRGGGALPGNKP